MKRVYLALAFALWSSLAAAQWQVPAGSIPVGRGDPVQGFNSLAPGASGNCILSNGSIWQSTTCASGTVPLSGITGLGTGVGTALGIAVGSAGAPVVNGGVLGTPSSGVGTNLTALNASNLGSGTVAASRGGAGTITGALKANGTGTVTQAACADLSNGAASCSTDTTNAANITSGTLPNARITALPNANLANSSVTIAGKSTALGAAFSPARAAQAGGSIGAGTAAGPVMGGLGSSLAFTPATTGTALVIGSWTVSNSVASDGCTISFAFGTGVAPAHNAAPVGTVFGTSMSQSGYGAAGYTSSLANMAYVTGLTPGTAYWFDIQYAAVTGGTCSVNSSGIQILEMWQ